MALKPVFWSHSSLSMFETCPRQYYEVKVRKSVKQENYAQSAGAKKHKEIELYLLNNTPVSAPEIKSALPVVDHFRYMPGKLYVEHQMALDEKHQPVDFKDWNNAWLRAVSDALVVNGEVATNVDWKFGKPRDGDDQLRLSSAVIFAHFPRVQRVESVFVYFENKIVSPTYTYDRSGVMDTWSEYGRRYSELLRAARSPDLSVWVPKPSGLCKKWCPVTTCEFNGNYVPVVL
jgi:hypothetical protein